MYYLAFSLLACLSIWNCALGNEVKSNNHCGFLKQLLESSAVSVKINKNGFHREIITSVEFSPHGLHGARVLLVHRWPRGVYVDPFQLASLSDHNDWQILLDSSIDLEVPAHKTSGFVTYVFPSPVGPNPRLLKVTIPIHARYHEPSFDGKTVISVDIEPPELLFQTEECSQLVNLEPHIVVDAPCTPDNSSTCSWVKLQHRQEQEPLSLRLPVGDASLVTAVCSGTLLVTMICCMVLQFPPTVQALACFRSIGHSKLPLGVCERK